MGEEEYVPYQMRYTRDELKREIYRLKDLHRSYKTGWIDDGKLDYYISDHVGHCSMVAVFDEIVPCAFEIEIGFQDRWDDPITVEQFHKIFTPETLEAIHKVLNDKINELKANQSPH